MSKTKISIILLKSIIHIQESHNVIENNVLYAQLVYRVVCQVDLIAFIVPPHLRYVLNYLI